MSYYHGTIPGSPPAVPCPSLPPRHPYLARGPPSPPRIPPRPSASPHPPAHSRPPVPPRPTVPPRPPVPSQSRPTDVLAQPSKPPQHHAPSQPPHAAEELSNLAEHFAQLYTRPEDEPAPPPYSPDPPEEHGSPPPLPNRPWSTMTDICPITVPDQSTVVSTAYPGPALLTVAVHEGRRSARPHDTVSTGPRDGRQHDGTSMPRRQNDSLSSSGPASAGRRSPRPYSSAATHEPGESSQRPPRDQEPSPPARQSSRSRRICPKGIYVDWCTWYNIDSVPGFNICEECYTSHVQRTAFGDRFKPRPGTQPGMLTCCDFNRPRMLQVWDEAVSARNLDVALSYMARRVKIPACHGLQGVKGGQGLKWYSNHDLAEFVACEACYEDIVCSTSFAAYFTLNLHQHAPGDTWVCDIAHPCFGTALTEYSRQGYWRGFVDIWRLRQSIPGCPGDGLQSATARKWFKPRSYIPDAYVCDACYHDHIVFSGWADLFEPVQTSFMSHATQQWKCCLAISKIKLTWDVMLEEKLPFQVWWEATRVVATTAACTAEGVEYDGWYVLAEGCENFDICPGCFYCWVRPWPSFAQKFKLRRYPPGSARICDFTDGAPRAREFRVKFARAVDMDDYCVFADYVKVKANMPICRGSTAVTNSRWWGIPGAFTACEECYTDVAKGTALDNEITARAEFVEKGCMCELYSPRMRALWKEACEKRDITLFTTFAQHRRQVYEATVPRCQFIVALTKARASIKTTNLIASSMVMGGDRIVGASMTGHHAHYGNSSVGYGWNTMAGAHAAQQSQAAMGMSIVSGGEMMEVAQLEAMWKQVE